MQMISTVDIGVFAAIAFENRDAWLGRRLEIAGDTTSAQKQADALSALRGGESWRVKVPPEWVFKLFIPKPVARLRAFLQKKGTRVDVGACKAVHPGLMSFEDWCRMKKFDTHKFPADSSACPSDAPAHPAPLPMSQRLPSLQTPSPMQCAWWCSCVPPRENCNERERAPARAQHQQGASRALCAAGLVAFFFFFFYFSLS